MEVLLTSIKALSAAIRVRLLLLLLEEKEACVCELMEVFDMAQSKLSHHLIALRDAGFLQDEKRGKWNYYRLNTRTLNPINQEILDLLTRRFAIDPIAVKDRQKLKRVSCSRVTTN